MSGINGGECGHGCVCVVPSHREEAADEDSDGEDRGYMRVMCVCVCVCGQVM